MKKSLSYVFMSLLVTLITMLQPLSAAKHSESHHKHKKHHSNESAPQLMPWQYWDAKRDWVVTRVACFNLIPDVVSNDKLKSIYKANQKDFDKNFAPTSHTSVKFHVLGLNEFNNPKYWDGTWVLSIVQNFAFGAFGLNFYQNDNPGSDISPYSNLGFPIEDLLPVAPPAALPNGTPWVIYEWDSMVFFADQIKARPDVLAGLEVPDAYQQLSGTINHEFKEVLGSQSRVNFVNFDSSAPAIQNMQVIQLDDNGYQINGTTDPLTGNTIFPSFLDYFPEGGTFSMWGENCDPLQLAVAPGFNGYYVDCWLMCNVALQPWFFPNLVSDSLQFDFLNHTTYPLETWNGFSRIVFTDNATGLQYKIPVLNMENKEYSYWFYTDSDAFFDGSYLFNAWLPQNGTQYTYFYGDFFSLNVHPLPGAVAGASKARLSKPEIKRKGMSFGE